MKNLFYVAIIMLHMMVVAECKMTKADLYKRYP